VRAGQSYTKSIPAALACFLKTQVVNRSVGERLVGVPLPGRVFEWPEERTLNVVAMAGGGDGALFVGLTILKGYFYINLGGTHTK
jgi:hypothetical protein